MADAVHLELDLLDATTLAALSACQLLPRGQSLADVLPRPLFVRLRRHLNYVRQSLPAWMESAGIGDGGGRSTLYASEYLFNAIAGDWERKRPVYVLLMVNSLTESDVRARGTPVLDLYLAQEADRAGKQLAAVELVEEHCFPLNAMNLSQVRGVCFITGVPACTGWPPKCISHYILNVQKIVLNGVKSCQAVIRFYFAFTVFLFYALLI